ncbi:hypothetical protein M3Y97_00301300 [Aphelenchoides bicaudatus]|nr:hypothetical protein M3Y97_00301300 [Aphelenchoides bicaudatus]
MRLITFVLLTLFVGMVVGKIVRKRESNSYGDEPVTPASTGEVHEATETSEGSGSAVEGSGSSASGSGKGAGYSASESSGEAPKEHESEAVQQPTQKSQTQQASGYRK